MYILQVSTVIKMFRFSFFLDPIFVIMEYVSNGKLQSFLRNSRATRSYDNMHGKSNTLTSRHLTSFCYQIARGMQFLSSKGVSFILIINVIILFKNYRFQALQSKILHLSTVALYIVSNRTTQSNLTVPT